MSARQINLVITGALLLAAPLAAQKETPPAPGTPKAFRLPPRTSFTLPNGMRVTLVPYGVVPKVAVSLSIGTGGIDESPTQIQLSDLTASMLLEGTTTRSSAEISRAAAEMGGALGAAADDDQVTLGGQVLSESAERYLGLLADVTLHPRFAPADVNRLTANMIRDNSIAQSQPGQISRIRFRQLVLGDHPYARVIAPDAMLQGYTATTVREFYQKNFGARRAHLYISGVFNPATIERAVRAGFSRWASGSPATSNPPVPVSRRQLDLTDRPDAVQSSLRVGLPVADPANADWIPLNVADALLGGSFGSRITSNIREDKGYTYSPFSFVASWPKIGVWAEVADVTTSETGASLKEIFGEIDRLRNEAPSEKELTGIKNGMVGQFTVQNSSRDGVINQLQFVDQYGLGDGYLSRYVGNIMAVSPAEIQRMAQRYFDPTRMTITVVGDKKVVEDQIAPYRGGTP